MLRLLSEWKTTVLVVSAVLFIGLLASRHLVGPHSGGSPTIGPISASSAQQHIGERAEVCGRVVEVERVSGIGGEPTFLNLGGAHPNQDFTAVIWASDRLKWSSPPEVQYEGQSICVRGSVERHEGTPQIVVSSPQQIHVQ